MYKSNFKILYHFENNNICILEIKRNGIVSEDKSKIYHWLMYDKVNDLLQPLVFVSMSEMTGKEVRKFNGYSLEFSTDKGILIEDKTGSRNVLEIIKVNTKLDQALKEAIDNYFLLLSFKDSSSK